MLDAFYRFMPGGGDENDNGTMANIYNRIDAFADRLGWCFVLIHHSTKGSQTGKSVTDVGAGAGAQSRATDTHLVLRPHEEDGVVVLDAAVRSWKPVEPMCLRWSFPVWTVEDGLDPASLKNQRAGKKREQKAQVAKPEKPSWDVDKFVGRFISNEPVGNSSGYNYASGRLDHQTFFKSNSRNRNPLAPLPRTPAYRESESARVSPPSARQVGGSGRHPFANPKPESAAPRPGRSQAAQSGPIPVNKQARVLRTRACQAPRSEPSQSSRSIGLAVGTQRRV